MAMTGQLIPILQIVAKGTYYYYYYYYYCYYFYHPLTSWTPRMMSSEEVVLRRKLVSVKLGEVSARFQVTREMLILEGVWAGDGSTCFRTVGEEEWC